MQMQVARYPGSPRPPQVDAEVVSLGRHHPVESGDGVIEQTQKVDPLRLTDLTHTPDVPVRYNEEMTIVVRKPIEQRVAVPTPGEDLVSGIGLDWPLALAAEDTSAL
jgi:hypothetical protein